MAEGIEVRHAKGCRSLSGGRCNCNPTYRAGVWSNRDRKRIRRTFKSSADAKTWRADALIELQKGTMRAPTPTTVQQAGVAWVKGARAGTILNRSGDAYKPSAIRGYEKALRLRIVPTFGTLRLADLRPVDVQDFVDAMVAEGLSASTIDTTLNPLRAIYRRAVMRGEVGVNPTQGIERPAVRGRRERFASPEEAAQLIAAVPDRALWATAMYAGLRRGELRALDWKSIDLAEGTISVERSWDDLEGPISAKSAAGRRKVPIAAVLRDPLVELRIGPAGNTGGLVFGEGSDHPFRPETVQKRADSAWEAAGLDRITLHECRHTFASLMIAAGVNAKALSTYMGHANIAITLDRYGHLMPGSEQEAAGLLDSYLAAQRERAADHARAAEPTGHSWDNEAPHRRDEAGRGGVEYGLNKPNPA